jgi:hypothetical protein
MGGTVRWLMFMYQVPSEPSRLRTAVWRRLKALGAVYAAHSVAVLPESPEAERALRAEVGQMGGAAQLVRAEPLLGQADFTARYNQARDEEYAEVIGRCEDFLAEIAKEAGAGHFSYAELEENDEDLAKLRNCWARSPPATSSARPPPRRPGPRWPGASRPWRASPRRSTRPTRRAPDRRTQGSVQLLHYECDDCTSTGVAASL